jgi:hypothetical protein
MQLIQTVHWCLLQDNAERHALQEHMRLLAALARGMTLQEEEQHLQQLADDVHVCCLAGHSGMARSACAHAR